MSIIHQALEYVASSKTLVLWLILALLATAMFLLSLVALVAFDVNNPYLDDILNFFGICGGGGTARNIISDGIMPRIPQAAGAIKDPSIALQPPTPMQPKPNNGGQ